MENKRLIWMWECEMHFGICSEGPDSSFFLVIFYSMIWYKKKKKKKKRGGGEMLKGYPEIKMDERKVNGKYKVDFELETGFFVILIE